MAITKKVTKDMDRTIAVCIKSCALPQDELIPYVSFSDKNNVERAFPCTDNAFARMKYGERCKNYNLRKGFVEASARFSYMLLLDKKDKGRLVVGAHCLPTSNYMHADFAVELKNRNLTPESVVVDVHPETGELDVVAYPNTFRSAAAGFVRALEGLSEIDEFTSFTVKGTKFSVDFISGTTVAFTARKEHS